MPKMPENDVEGIKDPTTWPNYPILPVKSKDRKPGDMGTMAVLIDPERLAEMDRLTNTAVAYHAEAPYSVFAINMFMIPASAGVQAIAEALAKAPRRDYPTAEDLCEKWVVD